MKITTEIKKTVPFQYAAGIKSGALVSGKYIKLAVDRFYRWIETAEDDGYYLDHEAGMRVINFFVKCINHTKGAGVAGKPFELSPFQQFTQYNLFAWKKTSDGTRRIKTVYDQRAKKNGKSAEMAGMSLYVMADDGENEAEIYVGATKEDQAKICWTAAKNFIESPLANQYLKAMGFTTRLKEIRFNGNGSKMMPLGGDSKTQDGINSHFSIIDEYHAHKDDGVKENLESSAVLRVQPVTYHITTAGNNIQSVCYNYAQVCKSVLDGTNDEDDSLWIMIHEMDQDDDWSDTKNWIKANPLLGNGLSMDRLLDEYHKCVLQPSKLRGFKTKNLNMWVDEQDPWIENEVWMRNNDKVKIENFIKFGCVGAFDLSTTTDLTSLAFMSYPDEDGVQDLICFNFCPKDTIDKRSREDRVPYRFWSELAMADYCVIPKGQQYDHLRNEVNVLTASEGNVVDYNVMQDYVEKYNFTFLAESVNYDRHNSTQLVTNLGEAGVNLFQFAQTIMFYSTPTKEFEKLALSGKLRHGGNPILQWSLTGCGIYEDPNENIRLSKKHSTKRIDPLIASVMAQAGIMHQPDTENKESVYNSDKEYYA